MSPKFLPLFLLLGLLSIHASPVSNTAGDAGQVAPVPLVAAEPVKDGQAAGSGVETGNLNSNSKPEGATEDQKFIFPLFSMGFPQSQPPAQPAPPPPAPVQPAPQVINVPPNSQIQVISQGTPVQLQQANVVQVGSKTE